MENPLKSLKITNYHSYLLVVGGLILIFSLFVDSNIVSQGKLAILSLITIFYGLFEWIRETNHKNKVRHLNQELLVEWEEASGKKTLDEIRDSSWDSNFRKNFMKKHNAENIIPNYLTKTWIFFVIYLILMFGTFYFL